MISKTLLSNQSPIGISSGVSNKLGIEPIACGDGVLSDIAGDAPRLHMTQRETLQGGFQRCIQIPAFIEELADCFPFIGVVEQIETFDDDEPRGWASTINAPSTGSPTACSKPGQGMSTEPADDRNSWRRCCNAKDIKGPSGAPPCKGFGRVGKML